MTALKFNFDHAAGYLSEEELNFMQDEVSVCHDMLINKTGKGNDFLGWINLPDEVDETLLSSIEEDALNIRKSADILVVIGIGGSYLGARAVIDALSSPFASYQKDRTNPLVIFAGNNISQDYHAQLLQLLDNREYAIAVISKSGTTTEPALAFRLLKNHIEQKYGLDEASKRIIAITDKSRGALKNLANKQGYKTYIIPDDIGGRYSVLTPVGMLPVAVAGYDIRQLIAGAAAMRKVCVASSLINESPAACYAAARTSLYRMGKQVEILANYEPGLHYITEWWKQLYGESEGKNGEGLFPAGVDFTADLHSMGQYIQEGQRILLETVLHIEKPEIPLTIPFDPANLDGINFIAGKTLHEVNTVAALGTTLAHMDGDVPNLDIYLPAIDEHSLGELIYFFEFACGLSGYLLSVNPFDQPGVEAYKKNMFALLGKPGYEADSEALRKRLSE